MAGPLRAPRRNPGRDRHSLCAELAPAAREDSTRRACGSDRSVAGRRPQAWRYAALAASTVTVGCSAASRKGPGGHAGKGNGNARRSRAAPRSRGVGLGEPGDGRCQVHHADARTVVLQRPGPPAARAARSGDRDVG